LWQRHVVVQQVGSFTGDQSGHVVRNSIDEKRGTEQVKRGRVV
jgi:hypothetical protein